MCPQAGKTRLFSNYIIGQDFNGELSMTLNEIKILGSKLHTFSMAQCLDIISTGIEQGRALHVITLNAEMAYQARRKPELLKVINQADLVTADGIGVVWGARHLGYTVPERVTGIDLMNNLAERAARQGWRLYLLGAAPGIADEAARQLQQRWTGLLIAGRHDGYFTTAQIPQIVAQINASQADILFVALGAPKQEYFIRDYRHQLQAPVMIGVGGSLDVIAGAKKRAPQFFIRWNLEWLYRLLSEPSRFKRQMILPLFVSAILLQGLKSRQLRN